MFVYFGNNRMFCDDGDFSQPKGQKIINNWPSSTHVFIIYKIYTYFKSGGAKKKYIFKYSWVLKTSCDKNKIIQIDKEHTHSTDASEILAEKMKNEI